MGRTHAGTVLEDLQPVGRTLIVAVVQDCIPWDGPHIAGGET